MKHLHLNVQAKGLANQQFEALLSQFNEIKEILMATKEDASAKLDQINGKLDKISGETTGLVTEVRSLKEAAQNAGIPDEIMQRIESLAQKADSIDSQVDDVAPNPTPTPEDTGGGGAAETPTA